VIADDVRAAFVRHPGAWRRFGRFPAAYRRIRIAWVEGARKRPAEFERRLRHLVKRSAKNERFGITGE
jgi:hypothetical protein